MEVGDIKRFKTDGDFVSYCRMVDARRLTERIASLAFATKVRF
jgi:hypothetical protein